MDLYRSRLALVAETKVRRFLLGNLSWRILITSLPLGGTLPSLLGTYCSGRSWGEVRAVVERIIHYVWSTSPVLVVGQVVLLYVDVYFLFSTHM